ncbi:MAG: hypothetical protein JKY56_14630 [Kofleriaceae bacterium]|nr:hypothetical protein [Kofleriaceae bacterium]
MPSPISKFTALVLSLLANGALAACGSSPMNNSDPKPDATSQSENDERFVGDWLLDQPYHATYEATAYRFSLDGTASVLGSCNLSGREPGYVTGTVETENVHCQFGNSWSSDGPGALIIGGDCNDEQDRAIELLFQSDASTNSQGAQVVIGTVGGEPGWEHRDFKWNWTKCPSSGCQAQLCDLGVL